MTCGSTACYAGGFRLSHPLSTHPRGIFLCVSNVPPEDPTLKDSSAGHISGLATIRPSDEESVNTTTLGGLTAGKACPHARFLEGDLIGSEADKLLQAFPNLSV